MIHEDAGCWCGAADCRWCGPAQGYRVACECDEEGLPTDEACDVCERLGAEGKLEDCDVVEDAAEIKARGGLCEECAEEEYREARRA